MSLLNKLRKPFVIGAVGLGLVGSLALSGCASSRVQIGLENQIIEEVKVREIPIGAQKHVVTEIYVVDADGSEEPRKISEGGDPSWSHDGSEILYSIPTKGIVVYNLTTDKEEVVIPKEEVYWVGFPLLSPDGSKIVYASGRERTSYHEPPDLFVAKANGSDARRIVKDVSGFYNVSWSPDGKKIAFDDDTSEKKFGIYEINVESTFPLAFWNKPKLVSDANRIAVHPIWSSDGREIAFTSTKGEADSLLYTISIVNEDGTNQRDIFLGDCVIMPSLSPDDRYFACRLSLIDGVTSVKGIGIIDRKGNLCRIIDDSSDESVYDWSPNGKYIAFSSDKAAGNEDLYIAVLETGGVTRLTHSNYDNINSVLWSPDGMNILYTSERVEN